MSGKLFIIGVGPGDPGLVTVRAAEILRSVKKVFIPVSGEGRISLAYEIAQDYIPAETTVSELVFPMTFDAEMLENHYMENFKRIETVLRQGSNAALITVGDSGLYSTSWTVFTIVKELAPDIAVEIVPGITSYTDAAARAGISLAEGNDVLSVISAYDDPKRIESVIDCSDTVVFLKTYKKRDTIIETIKGKGFLDQCIYIRRSGLEGQEIIRDMSLLPDEIDYFSMIILKKQNSPQRRKER